MRNLIHKTGLLIAFIWLFPHILSAQPYGNEWINFSQSYFKLGTAENSIYRVTYNELQQAGFPVNSVDPRRMQLFHRGEEQAIYFPGQSDGSFDPGEFFEFYGQRNDGTLDANLYTSANAQPNPFRNIYSDSTFFFLTFSSSVSGKRMSTTNLVNTGGLLPEPYHIAQELQQFFSRSNNGLLYNSATRKTEFDFGEGWTGEVIVQGNSQDLTFQASNEVISGPDPNLVLSLVGRNNNQHIIDIQVGPNSGNLRTLQRVNFIGYANQLVNAPLLWSDFSGSGALLVRVFVNNAGSDRISVAYANVEYAQSYDMQGLLSQFFYTRIEPNDTSYIEIQNAGTITDIFDITDPSNVIQINFSTAGNMAMTVVTGTSEERKLWIRDSDFLSPSIERNLFRSIDPTQHNYLILTNSLLRQPGGDYSDPIRSYSDYRASVEGGSFDTLVVHIDQIFNQFSYGEYTPWAIYKFMEYMVENGNPEYFFIIGKGLYWFEDFYRNGPQNIDGIEYRNLVPSAGFPGSDIYFTAGLDGSGFEPAVSTGRLTAKISDEVAYYLDKVKEMESTPFNDLWRKNLIHLSGGQTPAELGAFKGFVDEFKAVAENDFLGGDVVTQSKQTNAAVELINVAEEVNSGVSLITFFGHSAPTLTDIDIGKVSDPLLGYDNKGRYPAILVNGCNAGNIFSTSITFGEDWIITKDLGSLNFLAHAATGFSGDLKNWTDNFYGIAYGDSTYIDQPFGLIHKEVTRQFMDGNSTIPRQVAQAQQMILQGDPFVKLFGADLPDFEINDDNLFLTTFDGSAVTALTDSFQVGMIVRNFGRTTLDSLSVTISRTLSDGSQILYGPEFYNPIRYQDTLFFTIKPRVANAFGNNRFEISLDPNSSIAELDELNNLASLNFFIPLAGTNNLLPANFSILGEQPLELIAQSSNILAGTRDFRFELDTTDLFNSPVLQTNVVNNQIIAKWQVNLLNDVPSNDSIVYYWRTRFQNPLPDEDTTWTVNSFTYIMNSPPGWSQSHFPQFKSNITAGVEPNQSNRQWEFISSTIDLDVTTYGANNPLNANINISVIINGVQYMITDRFCRNNSINAIAFDQASTVPYVIFDNGDFDVLDPQRCGRTPQVINTLNENDVVNSNLLEEYINRVSDGDYVLIFSIGTVNYPIWPAATQNKLTEIGASPATISALQSGDPYIILGRKGSASGTAIEELVATVAPANEQQLDMTQMINGSFNSGSIESPKIGPSLSWQSFFKKSIISELPQTDQLEFDIVGIDFNNSETILFDNVIPDELDISSVDHLLYPYLKLDFELSDEVNLTPPQLSKWQVLYALPPEGVLITQSTGAEQEVREGEVIDFNYTFYNISEVNFPDSLTVRYILFNQDQRTSNESDFKIAPIAAGDSVPFSISVQTLGRAGINDLSVFVNPFEIAEQDYDNNVISLPGVLNVIADNEHPVLDVSFDGVYILDGDIVSANPLISIRVRDENKILLKQDTLGMEIFFRKPGENSGFESVSFTNPDVKWFSETSTDDFQVEFSPRDLEDGVYTLRVQAVDASGNLSGVVPYLINFEVVNQTSVTNFYPYPNPFSTSVRFVFTLTGSEIPDEIKIQIMTVTGKIVREITQDEIGSLHIGNNLTEYAWDGRDEFGDQLANGVYLYKVYIQLNGNSIDRRKTSADRAFDKGFGKLYLLR